MKEKSRPLAACASFVTVFMATVAIGLCLLPPPPCAQDEAPAAECPAPPPRVLSSEDVKAMIPSHWKIAASGKPHGGWCQLGTANLGLDETLACVTSLFGERGYRLNRRVAGNGSSAAAATLVAYANADGSGRVMWAFRPAGRNHTSFSWGIEK